MKNSKIHRVRYILAGFLSSPRKKLEKKIISQKYREHPDAFLEACRRMGIKTLPYNYLEKYAVCIDVTGGSITQDVILNGNFQFSLLENFRSLFDVQGARFVNVGANIGTTCLNAHAAGFREFIAFEPVKENFLLLEANLENVDGNFILHNLAVGDENLTKEIFVNPRSTGRHSFKTDFGLGVSEVEVVKLDGFIDNGKAVVWIDVEGSEYEVLIGAQNFIEENVEAICVELTPHLYPDKIKNLVEFLNDNFSNFYDGRRRQIKASKLKDEITNSYQLDLFAGKS